MKRTLSSLLFAGIASFLLLPKLATAQPSFPCTPGSSSLPSNDPEYPANQLILICVPPNWNGDLILYARGYVPPQAPLALPIDELTLADGTVVPAVLLSRGFAFATSSYHKNGVATEQGLKDLLDLLNHFESTVPAGAFRRVFIVGASEGGLTALQLLEQHPDRFSAGLALCAPAGGAIKQIKHTEDFRIVFDYFFPDVFPFGAFDVPADAFAQWDSIYVPRIIAAMSSNPRAIVQLFSVTRAAFDPADLTTAVETALGLLFYSIWGTNDLIATGDGIPYDNRFTLYLGLTNNLALNRGVERIRGDHDAELYALRFYQTTGKLIRPLVMLNNTLDSIVPFEHALIYSALTKLQGMDRFLTVLPIKRYGHCDFTTSEILNAFGLMLQKASPH